VKTLIMSCLSRTVLVFGLIYQSGNTMEVKSFSSSSDYDSSSNSSSDYDSSSNSSSDYDSSSDYELIINRESLKYRIEKHRWLGYDNFQPLSYGEFVDYQEQEFISKQEAEELTNHAYAIGNPILFHRSDEEVSAESYCLNFLWIHSCPPPIGVKFSFNGE